MPYHDYSEDQPSRFFDDSGLMYMFYGHQFKMLEHEGNRATITIKGEIFKTSKWEIRSLERVDELTVLVTRYSGVKSTERFHNKERADEFVKTMGREVIPEENNDEL